MSLSVIIPSRDLGNLTACIQAVQANEPRLRIIVVDDGLEPHQVPQNVIEVKGQKPFIFARNCNLGIKAAGHDDVILLNDDALLMTPRGFSILQWVAREKTAYGVIGAVTNVTGQPQQFPRNEGLRAVPTIAFVCVLIPRRTIDLVGVLDERYSLDYGVEDADYCMACEAKGLLVGVYDHVFIDHAQLHSTYRGDPHACRSFARNQDLFNRKWGLAQ